MLGLIFTYAMSYGGAAMALINPYIGLLVYVCFAILRPGVGLWYWSVPDGNFSKILAGGLVVGWLLRGAGDWRFGRAAPVVFALIGFLVWNILSAIPAVRPAIAWERVEELSKIVLVVVVGATLIDSVAKLRQMAWVILVSHGYVSYDLNVNYFNGFNRLHENGFGGMDNNCVGITLVACTGMGIFLCLSAPKLWQKSVAAVCIGLMVHAILFSFSRGAMLGLIIVVASCFFLLPRRAIHYLALFGGAGLVLMFSGQQVVERFQSTFASKEQRDESSESRILMWGICLRVTAEHPLLGVGPHHFPVYAAEYGLPPMKEAHTTWLQLATENGVPGVTMLLMFYTVPIIRLWTYTRRTTPVPDPFLRDIARMVIASSIGFLFTAQFVSLPGLEAPYYITMLGAGALRLLSTTPAPHADMPVLPAEYVTR